VAGVIVRFLAFWFVLGALYALFAGEVSLGEVIAGVIATGLALAYGVLAHRFRSRVFAFQGAWIRLVIGPLTALGLDSWRVGQVLFQTLLRRPDGSLGMLSRQPFYPGGNAAPDSGRRGMVTLALSLAPNGYVLGIEESDIILHRLAPAAPSTDREWPA
jgi:hypothetical protein